MSQHLVSSVHHRRCCCTNPAVAVVAFLQQLRQHNGRCVSGAMLAALTEELVSSIDLKGVPELLTSWQQVCKQETLRAFQQAVRMYDAEWSTGPLPVDDAAEIHKKALEKSLQARSSQNLA